MLLTLVPCFNVIVEPFTFKSLINTTASPSASGVPLESRTILSSAASASTTIGHSCEQSGHTKFAPSG